MPAKRNPSSRFQPRYVSSRRFNFEEETPTTNFDTFPAAILTVFQVRHRCGTSKHIPQSSRIDDTLGGGRGEGVRSLQNTSLWYFCPPPPDPDGRGLECSDVPWDRVTGGRSAWNVLLDLLHRSDPLWKLYPLSLLSSPNQLTLRLSSGTLFSPTTVKSLIVAL